MTIRFGSVCSGIEAASVAWHPLGWRAAFLSEIEAFPRAVLRHHYPEVPLHGDFTTIQADDYEPIDLLVGGTPCQSFSVAGLRGGLDDERGNLALDFLRLARRLSPRWLVWENVPGVLSSNGGRDFGAILGGMVELGYGVAYRILDAQYFGVPQRRRRLFVVGYLGDWRCSAAVLFERHSLSGHPPPRREAGKGAPAGTLGSAQGNVRADEAWTNRRVAYGGNNCSGAIDVAATLTGHGAPAGRLDFESETFVAHTLRGQGFAANEDGTERGIAERVAHALDGGKGQRSIVGCIKGAAIGRRPENGPQRGEFRTDGTCYTLNCTEQHAVAQVGMGVRRLTPRECERLQGFPDDYTLVPYRRKLAADGPRYKAIGNSMAVPVMRWIGERIAAVNTLIASTSDAEAREVV